MELKIYGKDGNLKLTASPGSSSTLAEEVMGECSVSASFTHTAFVPLDVNDYTEVSGVKYKIRSPYRPAQKNTHTYQYQVKLYAPIHDAEDALMLYTADGDIRSEFSYDGGPREHLQLWVDNMNRIAGSALWSIGTVITGGNKTIDYNNLSCWNAAFGSSGIAAAFETEMWADGFVINLCKASRGETVELGYLQGLTQLSQEDNGDVKFFTRLFPLGSTRNIDASKYGHARLQLPSGAAYVDKNTELYGVKEAYEEAAFAGIYPKYTGTISSVRTEEKENEEGRKYTVYYFKDSGMEFNPMDYQIPDLTFMLAFQTGDLAGRGNGEDGSFEAAWHEDTSEWEIINVYPDETAQIPGGSIVPNVGDTYIPWNFSLPQEYVTAAEQAYAEAVDDFLDTYSFDTKKYNGTTDRNYIERNGTSIAIGQNVRLLSDEYFAAGYKDTRIVKCVRKLNDLSQATVTCTDQIGTGWKTSVDNQLSDLHYILTKQEQQTLIDIIKTGDNKTPSDYNVFSALKALATFLRKDKADSTRYLLKLLGGAEFGVFTQGLLGTGGAVTIDEDGNSHAEFDYLTIRKIATFIELLIQEAKSVGGMIVVSPSNMKVSKVEETDSAYRCYFEKTDGERTVLNQFEEGDQARRQTFNLETGQAYYWRLVTSVGDDYVDLSKTDCDTGSTVPQAGDEIVGIGNRTNKSRQSAIIISAYGDGSPSIRYYQGIDSYSLTGKAVKEDYYDLSTGRFKTVTYGDSYVGDREGNTFMKYDQENGVEVKGKVSMSSGSTGWENLEGLSGVIKDVSDAASAAQNAADNAQDAADNAQADAESANNRLDQWAEDGVISPTEKLSLKQELENLQSEYDTNIQNAQKYGIDTSAYTSAWTEYKQELEYHSQDTPENITIKETFATSQSSFYKSREDLLVSIANAAKEYADKLVSSVSVGAENLLLNTGFTGNYDPKVLSASTPLNKRTYMYSNRLENWSGAGTVNEDESSESGYSCSIGSISQSVSLIEGERYVISYKAKGSSVTVSIGSNTWTDSLSSSYSVYSHKFEYSSGSVFAMAGSADVCEIKLERGTIPTDWCPSRKDTNEVADMFKQYWYLKDAMNGSTDVIGGLVLTSMMQLGKWTDGVMEKVNAGISGIYNEDTDVAFWAGGTFEQAIATVRKIIGGENPSDEEWKSLAKFVATHGGDIFLRGYIYALGGVFRGTVYAEGGEFRGKFETSLNGQRIVIDPEDGSLKMLDEDGRTAVNISFSNDDGRMTAGLMITEYEGDTAWFSTRILGRSITMVNNISNYGAILLPDQIRFLSGGSELFSLSMSQDYTTGGKKVLITGSNWNETEGLAGTVYVDENGFLKVSKKEPVQPGA
ncbi:hypothetical protein [Bacteroides sp. An322]|uniref:hypothetical protein n=1 Tax=Bacteroides sp. An322 TaxID=1965632 RepID=UPI000B3A0702|nr:hypothetical protein [Bacteroides sp. An322]OUO23105.1 hypothetical protein B5F91_03130 [Bacteroides sp. An322]